MHKLFFVFFTFFSATLSFASSEFKFQADFKPPPNIVEDWHNPSASMRVTLIEATEEQSIESVQGLLNENEPNSKILYLNLEEKPSSSDDLEQAILKDERVIALPEEMALGLRKELSLYKKESSDKVKRFSKHVARIHFVSSLGAFTVISYLGEDLPHLAHWLVGFALAWECWLGQRFLIQINKFVYNVTDNFFKGSEALFKKLGFENTLSRFAVDLEDALKANASVGRTFPKKLFVSFVTLLVYSAEWAIYSVQHDFISRFFSIADPQSGSVVHSLFQIAEPALWAFVIKASLLDLFSEGIPHWAINNFSRHSSRSPEFQAKFIYAWSSAISLFVTFTTMGALATNIAAFKWIAFPIAAVGLGYFVFDSMIRNVFTKRKPQTNDSYQKTETSSKKRYSCFLRLSGNP